MSYTEWKNVTHRAPTTLYIDCEFNGFNGQLISMALVSAKGDEWYEVLDCPDPVPWVAENVMPLLDKGPLLSRKRFTYSLGAFLQQFTAVHIVADWPDDLRYFCEALITAPGEMVDTPRVTMELCRVDAPSEVPHNALHDARGIRDYIQGGKP